MLKDMKCKLINVLEKVKKNETTGKMSSFIEKNLKSRMNPYHRKCHPWELSLVFGLIFSCIFGSWLGKEQDELAEGVIRLHVVANSNSEYDQQLKYDVRDEILLQAEQLYSEGLSAEEMEAVFVAHLEEFVRAGSAVSGGQEVVAQVTDLYFPTKSYEDFSFPAGEYRALEVTLGEGDGENWWCVAYPPLCVGAASQTIDQAVEAGNFSQSEKELISGDYILKFKAIEIFEEMKAYFKK